MTIIFSRAHVNFGESMNIYTYSWGISTISTCVTWMFRTSGGGGSCAEGSESWNAQLDGRRQVRGNERYVEAANYIINIHKLSYDMYDMYMLLLLLLLPLLLRRLRLKRLLPLVLQASTKTERHDISGSTSSTGEYCPSSPACGTGFSISPRRVFFQGVAATFPPAPQKNTPLRMIEIDGIIIFPLRDLVYHCRFVVFFGACFGSTPYPGCQW